MAGLSAGIGNLFRPESVQLIIYGLIWLLVSMYSKRSSFNKPQMLAALTLLCVGFALPVLPYLMVLGFKAPSMREGLIIAHDSNELDEMTTEKHDFSGTKNVITEIVKAFRELTSTLAENLMHFFVPAWLLGVYYHLRTKAEFHEKFFIIAFLFLNGVMLTWLYCKSGFIARRHSLSLIALTIFYVPVGIQCIENWLDKKLPVRRRKTSDIKQSPLSWYLILLTAGIVVCLPKLTTPIRAEKKSYRKVAKWLTDNTHTDAVIAVPDDRISFYAGRKGVYYEKHEIPQEVQFVVKRVVTDKDMPKTESLYTVEDRSKNYKFVVYKPGA